MNRPFSPIKARSAAPASVPTPASGFSPVPEVGAAFPIGAEPPFQVARTSPTESAGAPNALTQCGPPTTHRMDGAGGPFNDWDCKIAKALARGDHEAAREIQQARADINIKFLQRLEPVWVPTEGQLAIGMMLRIGADRGICTVPETPFADDGEGLTYVERIAPGRIAC